MQTQFTEQSRRAVRYAQEAAGANGARLVEPEHLLLGILREDHSEARTELRAQGIMPGAIIEEVSMLLQTKRVPQSSSRPERFDAIPLSANTMATFGTAATVAARFGRHFTGPQHILMALILEPTATLQPIWERYGAQVESHNEDSLVSELHSSERTVVPPFAPNQLTHWGRYTHSAKLAIVHAQQEAARCGQNIVSVPFLLAGVLYESETVVAYALNQIGVERNRVRESLIDVLEIGADYDEKKLLSLSEESLLVVQEAMRLSGILRDRHIGTEHLFLGCLSDHGRVGDMLRSEGLTTATFLDAMSSIKRGRRIERSQRRGGINIGMWLLLLATVVAWLWLIRGS